VPLASLRACPYGPCSTSSATVWRKGIEAPENAGARNRRGRGHGGATAPAPLPAAGGGRGSPPDVIGEQRLLDQTRVDVGGQRVGSAGVQQPDVQLLHAPPRQEAEDVVGLSDGLLEVAARPGHLLRHLGPLALVEPALICLVLQPVPGAPASALPPAADRSRRGHGYTRRFSWKAGAATHTSAGRRGYRDRSQHGRPEACPRRPGARRIGRAHLRLAGQWKPPRSRASRPGSTERGTKVCAAAGRSTSSRAGQGVQAAEGELEFQMPQIRGAAEKFVSSVIPNARRWGRATRPSTPRAWVRSGCCWCCFWTPLPTRRAGPRRGCWWPGVTTRPGSGCWWTSCWASGSASRTGRRWAGVGSGEGLGVPMLIVTDGAPGFIRAMEELWPDSDRQGVRCTDSATWSGSCRRGTPNYAPGSKRRTGPRWTRTPRREDGEARFRRLVAELELSLSERGGLPSRGSAGALRAPRLPASSAQALRSTSLLERSLEEVKRRTKVIGRFPGERSCLSLRWAVLDLLIGVLVASPWSTGSWRKCVAPGWASRRTRCPHRMSRTAPAVPSLFQQQRDATFSRVAGPRRMPALRLSRPLGAVEGSASGPESRQWPG
jgi:hypothetical protein